MSTSARLLLACAVAAGGVVSAVPARAYCSPVTYHATGYCNPCEVVGVPWAVADTATGGALGPLYCLD